MTTLSNVPRDSAPGLSSDVLVRYLLAGRLQWVSGRLPEAAGKQADALCELRDHLVRSAESALPFSVVSPTGSTEPADAPERLIERTFRLLDELDVGATVGPAGSSPHDPGVNAEGGVAGAMAETMAFARRLHEADTDAFLGGSGPASAWVIRVCRTVMRPLCDELAANRCGAHGSRSALERDARRLAGRIDAGDGGPGSASAIGRSLAAGLHELLPDAATPALREALAGLQALIGMMPACDQRPDVARRLGLSATPVVRLVHDGPCLVEGGVALTDKLGDERPVREPMALCRCGSSGTMPLCDGSHVGARFRDAKSERREPDRLDRHAGQQITIRDNRGLCAHSGLCTDRLASVFHLGEEPFVSPSGARVDAIAQAIDTCPSGALSLHFDDRAEHALPAQVRPPSIEVSDGGPYRITGTVELVDAHGDPVEMAKGGTREHYSLCRCGASLNKPFCSGMHWNVTFEQPAGSAADPPSVYEWAGGQRLLLDMTRLFYARHVPDDPLIGPMFASMSPDHPVRVAAWLSEVFGGPALYSERYGGYAHMIREHLGKRITVEQRRRWVTLMARSADEAGLPDDAEFRAAFVSYLEWGSRIALTNSQDGATPPPRMPMPRWSWVADAYPPPRTPTVAGVAGARAPDDAGDPGDPVVVPADGAEIRFEAHVKPLFREKDRRSMRFVFDLWSEAEVREHGPAILARLEAGTMPCDGRWPEAHVRLLARWLEGPTIASVALDPQETRP